MELTERITSRVAELTSEAELLRKQLADAEHELDRLVIAGQVITQLMAAPADADEPADPEPAGQRGFGLLVPPRSQASGPDDLPDDYRPPERERPRQAQPARRPRLAAPHPGRQVHHRALT